MIGKMPRMGFRESALSDQCRVAAPRHVRKFRRVNFGCDIVGFLCCAAITPSAGYQVKICMATPAYLLGVSTLQTICESKRALIWNVCRIKALLGIYYEQHETLLLPQTAVRSETPPSKPSRECSTCLLVSNTQVTSVSGSLQTIVPVTP